MTNSKLAALATSKRGRVVTMAIIKITDTITAICGVKF